MACMGGPASIPGAHSLFTPQLKSSRLYSSVFFEFHISRSQPQLKKQQVFYLGVEHRVYDEYVHPRVCEVNHRPGPASNSLTTRNPARFPARMVAARCDLENPTGTDTATQCPRVESTLKGNLKRFETV